MGREYGYRKYIAGGETSSHRAIWNFSNASELRPLRDMAAVPLEFAFDVYRTTKGTENQGVLCSFDFVTWKWDQAREDEYKKEINAAFGSRNVVPEDESGSETAKRDWEKMNAIAEKFGRYEFRSYMVYDYHTYGLKVPPGLIISALDGTPGKDRAKPSPVELPRLQVKVKCESPSQFIGVAPFDLYFLEDEGSFSLNFFKAAIGLWCRLTIVIGLAVAASTYLAGVVSILVALFLFLAGYFESFIKSLAAGGNVGGGPFESLTRLVKGTTSGAELEKTPTIQAGLNFDELYRWMLRRLFDVIPDAERFTWSKYLEQGFSVRTDFIVLNLIFLIAYMLPWAVLAYYLMRSREIAA